MISQIEGEASCCFVSTPLPTLPQRPALGTLVSCGGSVSAPCLPAPQGLTYLQRARDWAPG